MHKYNIIYISPDSVIYLWNGYGFDKLEDKDREVLLYSGKSIKAEQVAGAIKACKTAIKQHFPGDNKPDIKQVEVAVS